MMRKYEILALACFFFTIAGLKMYFDIVVSLTPSLSQTRHTNVIETRLQKFNDVRSSTQDYKHESNVFRRMLERTSSTIDICQNLTTRTKQDFPNRKSFHDGAKPLPEHGLHEVIEDWLSREDENNGRTNYPTCHIPPPKLCDLKSVSVIIMSHTISEKKRINKMLTGIAHLSERPEVAEIILVWNAERHILTNSTLIQAGELMDWANDDNFPLRIFYALENGLENNLMNRYHPIVNPSQDAVMYFDDDGPFIEHDAMLTAFELWKFNSDTQVGYMGRNMEFSEERMNALQEEATAKSIQLLEKDAWQLHVSPNDVDTIATHIGNDEDNGYPKFTPMCKAQTQEHVKYNYNVFADFEAHMFLPSGSIIHKNYLCFIWHPLFEELRQFIRDHPTHPDDMVISTLVSHLSGKFLRSYPQRLNKENDSENRRLQESSDHKSNFERPHIGKNIRRRLLWMQEDWGDMREEAANSILNYFGSINPGSIGWCTGTKYQTYPNSVGIPYKCKPKSPTMTEVPWMNEGGIGYDQCHR